MAIWDRLREAAKLLIGTPRIVAPRAPNLPPQGAGQSRVSPPQQAIANDFAALLGRLSYAAGPTKSRYSSMPATGLTPERIYAAHQSARLGYPLQKAELDEEVLDRDAHLYGLGQARTVEVSGKPLKLRPFNETPVAALLASFCEAVLNDLDGFDQDVEDLLTATGRGYACSEISWALRNVRCSTSTGKRQTLQVLRPASLDWLNPKHFQFDETTDEPLLVLGTGLVRLPPGKFVFHASSGTGLIERRGYMQQCVWLHAIKQWSLRDWVVYSNLFGVPQILGKYTGDRDTLDQERGVYEAVLRDFGQGKPAIVSDEFQIEVENPPAGGKSDDVFGALIGWSNAEMSKRVQGQTLTTEIGGQGSYALGEVQADVKHAIVKSDARKLAQTLRSDLLRPMIILNSATLCEAFDTTLDELLSCIPRLYWRIERETTPEVRQRIFAGLQSTGLELDEEQLREEFGVDAPRPGSKALTPAKPPAAPPPQGASLSDKVEAASKLANAMVDFRRSGHDVDATDLIAQTGIRSLGKISDDPVVEKGAGDGGGSEKKGQSVEHAFAHGTQPRDAKGRFAPTGSAKASVADHVAKRLKDSGHHAEASGSTVKLKNGATIEIGANGERKYTGTQAKIQATVEEHLRAHPDKHVRDWASKTTPPPPPRRVLNIDPKKAAARAKAREAKQAIKDKQKAALGEAREANRKARTEAREAKAKAVADKRAAREEKKASQRAALQAIGAPLTPEGKVDASKVPGATKSFKPPTSSDPLHSFRGRSFVARSGAEMKSEFLGAAGRGGGNYEILTQQAGHLGVRDKTQWEAINEKYEANASTFDEAFAVLASAAGKNSPNKRPDWRDFDLGALRECAGLDGLEMPTWVHESQLAEGERDHYESLVDPGDVSADFDDDAATDEGLEYHPPDDHEDTPF